jgi:hypothetical protein
LRDGSIYIYICSEGFNPGIIKEYVRRLMGFYYHEKKINIVPSLVPLFGKKNIADRIAWEVNKKGKKPNLLLMEKHFKELGLI